MNEKFINELEKKKVSEINFLKEINKEYGAKFKDSFEWNEFPDRWRLANTDIVESQTRGFMFLTKFVKYNHETFRIESFPEDWILLLDHVVKQLKKLPKEITKVYKPKLNQTIKELKNLR